MPTRSKGAFQAQGVMSDGAVQVDGRRCGKEVTAEQAVAIFRSIKAAHHGAAKASLALALNGLGDTELWRRMDALEQEMQELLARLNPTLFFE